MSAQSFDVSGKARGQPQFFESTWEELRDHARFPAQTATRERVSRQTLMGELEGWLYRVAGETRRSKVFFADGLPGPPVIYSHFKGDTQVLRAEMIDRQEVAVALDKD